MSPIYRALLRAAAGVDAGGGGTPDPSAYNTAVLADSPVGYWKLDETSGTTASDSSGNANHGTYSGSPTLASRTLNGIFDSVSNFDGTDDHVSIPALGSSGWSAYTLEAWVTADALTAGRTIVTEQYTGSGDRVIGEMGLDINSASSTDLEFGRYSGISWNVSSPGYSTMSTSTLYHVVGVNDGSTGILYVNGVPVADTAIGVSSDNEGWYIGRRHDGNGDPYWDGGIGYVAIYDSALSHTRILEHYSAGSGNTAEVDYDLEVLADSPLIYLKFNEPSGSYAYDATANDKIATYNSTANITYGETGPSSAIPEGISTDGANSYVQTPTLPDLGHTQAQTYEIWAELPAITSATSAYELIGTNTAANEANAPMRLGSATGSLTGEVLTILNDKFQSGDRSGWTDTFSAGWHHIVLTYTGTQNSWTLYIDGSDKGSADLTASGGAAGFTGLNPTTVGRLTINGSVSPTTTYTAVTVSRLAIYDSALSSTRVAAHYTAGS